MERPCNGIEELFVKANVRFASAFRFPATTLEKASTALAYGLKKSGLDRIHVVLDSAPHLRLVDGNFAVNFDARPLLETSITRYLIACIAAKCPSEGPISAHLCTNEDGCCVAAVLDANHALCDGRTMRIAVEEMLGNLASREANSMGIACETLVDLEGLLLKSKTLGTPAAEPIYLPLGGTALPLSSIKALQAETKLAMPSASNVIVTVPGEVVAQCRRQMAGASSVTGLLVACLMHALAQMQLENGCGARTSSVIAVSVLVDLRPYLDLDGSIAQAFGTVTVGDQVHIDTSSVPRQCILDRAVWATANLRSRIERGEAHRHALALCRGRFDEGPPSGTIELSNHNVYQTVPGCEVALAQRFDGYEGVSVAAHGESASGALQLCASAGAMISRERLRDLFQRVASLCCMVAEMDDGCISCEVISV